MTWRRAQSHSEQVRQKAHVCAGCDDLTDSGAPARYLRRALLRGAVFESGDADRELLAQRPATAATVVSGVLTEVTSQAIVVKGSDGGDQFLALSPGTVSWLGARVSTSALRVGDPVIVRHRTHRLIPSGPAGAGGTAGAGGAAGAGGPAGAGPVASIAERIWARIGRVTGAIVAVRGPDILVDTGQQGREPQHVVIAEASMRHVQVRFPRLEPGYLIDVIGTRHHDYLLAVAPATTAQPPYLADHPPAAPPASGHFSGPISGTAVWHEPGDEPDGLMGLGYAALDPETEAQQIGPRASDQVQPCVRLPYLSLGSAVRISNECADRAAVLPVTSASVSARQFCDRCVTCGTSPRGRIADLTMAAFVELGGTLEEGCFNPTLTLAN
jgi:hypothetical protein